MTRPILLYLIFGAAFSFGSAFSLFSEEWDIAKAAVTAGSLKNEATGTPEEQYIQPIFTNTPLILLQGENNATRLNVPRAEL